MYQEQFLKTFKGGLHEPRITPREAKIYKNEDLRRCPINFLKKYKSMRLKNFKCDPMFLTALRNPTLSQWCADCTGGHLFFSMVWLLRKTVMAHGKLEIVWNTWNTSRSCNFHFVTSFNVCCVSGNFWNTPRKCEC